MSEDTNAPTSDPQTKTQSDVVDEDLTTRYISTGTGVLLGHYWGRSKNDSILPGFATATVSSDRPPAFKHGIDKTDVRIGVLLMLASLLIRLYDLPNPPATVHEETAIGSYVNKYIGRAFFPSSEPPLAPLMYYLVSLFFNYDGNFPFIKQDHIYVGSRVPYIEMRSFAAVTGIVLVLSAYYTVRLGGGHRMGALIASSLVLFDTSLAATSRYIFTEPIFLMFSGLSMLFWKLFERQKPFSWSYYFWGLTLAFNLGCVVSTRWIGVLTVVYILVASAYNVFWIFADLNASWWAYLKHSLFRVVAFTVIPLLVYATVLQAHLLIASGPHDGDYLLAPAHQDSINKHRRPPVHADIVSGSVLTLRHLDTHSYLHSHNEFYPYGSKQQQVSLYQHIDLNNVWVMENATKPIVEDSDFLYNFKNGDGVKLRHLQTTRRLHSHNVKAPVSENDYQFEVSAYGADGHPGDYNDMWLIEIMEQFSTPGYPSRRMRTLQTIFRLRHINQKCYLYGHRTQLPTWGFAQQEVTCNRYPAGTGALWYVETNYHANFQKEKNVTREMIHYGNMTQVQKVKDMHNVIKVSKEMVSKEGLFNSAPTTWPWSPAGIPVYRAHHRQVIVLANLVCWWTAFASIVVYILFKAYVFVRWQRGLQPVALSADLIRFDHEMGHALLAWLCHYIPLIPSTNSYTFMTYLPAFYITCVAAGHLFSIFFQRVARSFFLQFLVTGLVVSAVGHFYQSYRPIVAGRPWTNEDCHAHKYGLVDFNCDMYLRSYQDYKIYDSHHIVNYVKFSEEMYQKLENADSTNPMRPLQTLFKAREDRPEYDLTRPEVFNAIKLNDLERQNKLDEKAELEKSIAAEYKKNALASAGVKDASEEEDWADDSESTPTSIYDDALQKKIQEQWARITDPPALDIAEDLKKLFNITTAEKPKFEEHVDLDDDDNYDDAMAAEEIKGENVGHESVHEPNDNDEVRDVNTD